MVAMAEEGLLGCCTTSISLLCNLRASMILPNGIVCHSNCGQSQEIAQFRLQTEGEAHGIIPISAETISPGCAETAEATHGAARSQAPRKGNRVAVATFSPQCGTRAAKEWGSSAVQMPLVWDPASHLFFIQKRSYGRCRSRFCSSSFPFFFIVFAALALIEARLDAALTLVILFLLY